MAGAFLLTYLVFPEQSWAMRVYANCYSFRRLKRGKPVHLIIIRHSCAGDVLKSEL